MRKIQYLFKYIDECNMCGATGDLLRVHGRRMNTSHGFNPKKKIGVATTIMQCSKCGLHYSNPQPIPNNIQDHYGVPPDEYWIEEYLNSDNTNVSSIEKWEEKLGKIYPGFTCLEVGAGIGKQMLLMKSLGIDVYGIEPSKTFYDKALEFTNFSNEKLINCTIEEANFNDEAFDYINFGAVLEHLYNPSQALNMAVKWLKPSGTIHIEVPNARWLIGRLINFSNRVRGLDYVSNLSPMHKPFHLYEFTHESFECNSKINNYKISSYEYFICETYLPKIFDYVLKPIMKTTNTGMQLSIWLEKNDK